MSKSISRTANKSQQIIRHVFDNRYIAGAQEVPFLRSDLSAAANELDISVPKNLGDVIYSLRYRIPLPESIARLAPTDREWAIFPAGRDAYVFRHVSFNMIEPRRGLEKIKIPDATPGVISHYAMSDEQALLARIRYNRLLDIFTGVTCYSLQSHYRTTIEVKNPLAKNLGRAQVETDEIYVGINRHRDHHLLPIQAKGDKDKLSIIQIWQDFRVAEQKFPNLKPRPIAAQFGIDDSIVLLEFRESSEEIVITQERHYQLVPEDELTDDEVRGYRDVAGGMS